MGERDAFGREKGENTLADMGWSTGSPLSSDAAPSVERPATPDEPLVVASTVSPMDAGTAGSVGEAWRTANVSQRVRVHRPRPGRLLVPLFVVGVIGLGVFGVNAAFDAGQSALDDLNSALDSATAVEDEAPQAAEVPPGTVPEGEEEEAAPPAGTERGSLLRPAALTAALKKLPNGSLISLRVAPERIDAQVLVDGKLNVVQVKADGSVTKVATGTRLPIRTKLKVNAAAPNRIARTASRRARRDTSDVSYLVLMDAGGAPAWQLFFADGTHYSANASGTKVKRVGS